MRCATAVIPVLNEGRSLGGVLQAIPADLVAEVIVVDGGSSDDTVRVAGVHGATVITEPQSGYGRACEAGLRHAQSDLVVFLDGDGSADGRDIAPLLEALNGESADMVLGSRLSGSEAAAAMPWHQRAGNRVCAGLIRRVYGLAITDLGPFRAVRRSRLQGLRLNDLTYGWPTEMIVKAARAGWRIVEVPVSWHRRAAGRSKISGTVRGSALATAHILRTIAENARG
jgi:glycosyltransferase involved in cell wall biosynthesis